RRTAGATRPAEPPGQLAPPWHVLDATGAQVRGRVAASARGPPHRRDGRTAGRKVEIVQRPEAEPLVARQILRVARLEVRRHVLGIDQLEVLREQSLADAVAAVAVVGGDEAEVVVRLVMRMCSLE